ncbi:MAG: hypothetical protein H6523_12965 [Mycolicibacterium sp.]|nr:hypothetical protein [Mycolicibacterium sp.]
MDILDTAAVTSATTDSEIDAMVLAACRLRAAEADARIAAAGQAKRVMWEAELREMRDDLEPGQSDDYPEHFLARLSPHADGHTWWWAPFTVTAKTSDSAIALVTAGGVDRLTADDRSDARHRLAAEADVWTAELRRRRDALRE